MIAVSDAVLILVSAAALGSGLYRWQNNLEHSSFANARPSAQIQITSPPQVQNTNAVVAAQAPAAIPTPAPAAIVQAPQPTVTSIAVNNDTSASSAATNAAPTYGIHTVQSGEILGRIALRYDTTVATLQRINNLESTLIDVGQKLNYPLPSN